MKSTNGRRVKRALPYKRRARATARPSQGLKRYIKKVVHSNLETKLWNNYAINTTITSASLTTPVMVALIPGSIGPGTNTSQRIGSEITCVKGVISGYIGLRPYDAITNPKAPTMIKMWMVSSKLTNSRTIADTDIVNSFFDAGSGASATGFQGNLLDIMLPVNTKNWTVLKTKTIKLSQTYGTNYGSGQYLGVFPNLNSIAPFSFNFGSHLKTKLTFTENTNNVSNRNIWLVFQAVYSDGSSDALLPAEVAYSHSFYYKDA